MAEDAEVGGNNRDYKDKTVKKLISKNLNRAISYLMSKAKRVFA